MSNREILVSPEKLEAFLTHLFGKAGLKNEDAVFFAQALVQTNLWGIDSHGVLRAPVYVRQLLSGVLNPRFQIRTLRGSKGLEVLDADNGPGIIVGRQTMRRAIELAGEFNVGIVGAINSNHFGAAGIYARMAADQGMVGIAMTNGPPVMVAPGGSKPAVGNNPMAFAIPTFDDFPVVLDISFSTVARGKVILARTKGEKIPLEWATDKEGRPTDDADKAFEGFLLPVGGHKGFGLALIVDILSGVITGGNFLNQLKSMYNDPNDPSLTCHLMAVINFSSVIDRGELKSRMATFCETVKQSPMWDKTGEVLLPGELEYRVSLKREQGGIPLPRNLYDELVNLGHELGVSSSLVR